MELFIDSVYEQGSVLKGLVNFYGGAAGSSLLTRLGKSCGCQERPIILSGMGSSCFASRIAAAYLWSLGFPARFIEASELLHYGLDVLSKDATLILVSQSGESAEVTEILERKPPAASIVGVTNEEESTLAKGAELFLPILAGCEGTTASKTYTATLATLLIACRILSHKDTAPAFAAILRVADRLAELGAGESTAQFDGIAESLRKAKAISLVGRGPGVGTAMQAALTLKELAKVAAEGMEAAQFRHGPLEIANEDFAAVVITSSSRTGGLLTGLCTDLAACGAKVLQVSGGAVAEFSPELPLPPLTQVNEYFAQLVEIYPLQILADRLAKLLGNEGSFRWITKVTARE